MNTCGGERTSCRLTNKTECATSLAADQQSISQEIRRHQPRNAALNALAFSYRNELLDSYLYIGAGYFLANVRRSLFGVSRDPCV